MLYDYHGFPKETYSVSWPAPGAPEVAQEVQALLEVVTAWQDARFLERAAAHATRFTLQWGESRTLDLALAAIK
jgi:aromatic ring-opening dioxygenase catalytic subunit (LigB family)